MKRVFIIPEPHIWDKNFKNRKDYPGEISVYLTDISNTISAMDGDKIIIFPGDIFHQGFSLVPSMTRALNYFTTLNRITNNNVYSVVGNHELTYTACNPFWMMASDCTERFLVNRMSSTYGIFQPGIKVVDELAVGNLRFIFGHYGRTDYEVQPFSSDLVLISHNSIVESTVADVIQKKYGRETYVDYMKVTKLTSSAAIPITAALKYVFVGHMHTMYSKFMVDDLIDHVPMNFHLQYLGSLGRTTIREVNNEDLIRTVPQFIVEDDGTYTYEPFDVKLKPYEEVINVPVANENAVKAAKVRTLKQIAATNVFGDTPEACVRRELENTPECLTLFDQIFNSYSDDVIIALLKEANLL